MQMTTLTITTEQIKGQEKDSLFKLTSFEMKNDVFCDCCANSATGTEKYLKDLGWGLFATCQFCPNCNY